MRCRHPALGLGDQAGSSRRGQPRCSQASARVRRVRTASSRAASFGAHDRAGGVRSVRAIGARRVTVPALRYVDGAGAQTCEGGFSCGPDRRTSAARSRASRATAMDSAAWKKIPPMSEILPVCNHHERDSRGGCSVLERSSRRRAVRGRARSHPDRGVRGGPRARRRTPRGRPTAGGARRAPRRVGRAMTAAP
jgi:hypothetical protein